jgi:hypothetical protein
VHELNGSERWQIAPQTKRHVRWESSPETLPRGVWDTRVGAALPAGARSATSPAPGSGQVQRKLVYAMCHLEFSYLYSILTTIMSNVRRDGGYGLEISLIL